MTEALEQILIRQGRLSEADLARARRLQEQAGGALDVALVRMGAVSERHAAEAVAESLGLAVADTADYPPEPLFEAELSGAFLRQSAVIPLREEQDRLVVAMADPEDAFARQALRFATSHEIQPVVGLRSDIESAFERLYGTGRSAMEGLTEGQGAQAGDEDIEHLRDMASEAPVIRLVNMILSRAIDAGASDIHVEPFEDALRCVTGSTAYCRRWSRLRRAWPLPSRRASRSSRGSISPSAACRRMAAFS
jgi:general secretion pathway protein E